jgi:hypothetical protein
MGNSQKPKKRRWKGELAKPIYVGTIPTIETTDGESDDCEKWIREELVEKLALLMEHYEIADKDDFFGLALALAKDHVPGFRVVRNAPLRLRHGNWGAVIRSNVGRRLTWTPDRLNRLLDAVEETKKKNSLSTDREALEVVALNRDWSRPANHRSDLKQWLETLESRLQDAKRLRPLSSNSGN